LQLMSPGVFAPEPVKKRTWTIPCVAIRDWPRFEWRGMHLDVSRHFLPKKFIKTYIDMLAMHKMNVFHWHLTDDQGWRLEIKKYPKLIEVTAWRVDREDQHWNHRDPPREGEKATYGGYYTQDEIREIVKYADERNITVVPEIEMPAHTTALLAAYPQYSCTGGPFDVPPGGVWPITDIFCAGNDSTFYFLQDVLTEVMDLFPGKYIHIGGDEADKKEWKACAKCQARIKQEELKDEAELQSYFVKRIEKFIVSKGRRLIGWDEILEGGLAPEATVMSWRGTEGGIAATRQGHDAVMTPGSHCYFDHYQGKQEFEPLAIGGYTPLSKVYSYEPIPDSLTPEEAKHILGAQGNVWTE
ncbi:MAG: family 20 glycosylhydrolase, partial [Bacteroidota bacterium]